jgi:tRNA wybutosine-synthesizing protein 1
MNFSDLEKESPTIVTETGTKLTVSERVREQLEQKAYRLAGNHSAVQICSWTKKSLESTGDSHCYKQRFYGINCHKCAQITPVVAWCTERCTFCWRPMEFYKTVEITPDQVDPPRLIIEKIIKERYNLLIGYKGNEKVNKDFIEDALQPDHWAISLSGEPTMYPRLPELIRMLREEYGARSIFLVTNAQDPIMLQRLMDEDALPTQMYISVDAPNEELFNKINRSRFKDGWSRLQKSLEIYQRLPTRRIVRFTMIKDVNDRYDLLNDYKYIFELGKPDFIEIKAYMHLGYSQHRLKLTNMPAHADVMNFAEILTQHIPYSIIDEVVASRIALMQRIDSPYTPQIDFST